jgi:hypothetical protein
MRRAPPLLLLVAIGAGCSSGRGGGGFGGGDAGVHAGDSGGSAQDGAEGGGHPEAGSGRLTSPDAAPPDGTTPLPAVVYGQSGSTLYAVDPGTKAVTVVGRFSGCDSAVIDIALDKTSKMYATTYGGVYTVDTATAACTLLQRGTYPNSLSFVPAGTLDPTAEALVGYQGGAYLRIDTTTGAMTTVGSIGKGYSSSGDIVSVIGGGTYLTVTGGEACAQHDCLISVDPTTGALITNYGSVGYSQVYGLAFWAGTVYGFDNAGKLFEVTFAQQTIQVTPIPIPSAPPGLSFYGAGSTTSAPPVAVVK